MENILKIENLKAKADGDFRVVDNQGSTIANWQQLDEEGGLIFKFEMAQTYHYYLEYRRHVAPGDEKSVQEIFFNAHLQVNGTTQFLPELKSRLR